MENVWVKNSSYWPRDTFATDGKVLTGRSDGFGFREVESHLCLEELKLYNRMCFRMSRHFYKCASSEKTEQQLADSHCCHMLSLRLLCL